MTNLNTIITPKLNSELTCAFLLQWKLNLVAFANGICSELLSRSAWNQIWRSLCFCFGKLNSRKRKNVMESPQKQLLVFILLFWGNGFWTTGKNWNSRKQRKTQWKVFSFRELWFRKKEKARRTVLKHSESKRMEPNWKVQLSFFLEELISVWET